MSLPYNNPYFLIVRVEYVVKRTNYEFPHYVVILHPSLTSSLLRWPALIYILSLCSFLVLPHQRRGHEHVWNQTFSSVFRVILNETLCCLSSPFICLGSPYSGKDTVIIYVLVRVSALCFTSLRWELSEIYSPGHNITVTELLNTCEYQQCINVGNFFMISVSVRRLRYDASAAVGFFCCSGRSLLLQR